MASRKGRIYSEADKDYYGFYLAEEGFFTVNFAPSTTTADYRVSIVDENDFTLEVYTSTNGQAVNAELYNIPRKFFRLSSAKTTSGATLSMRIKPGYAPIKAIP